MCGLFGAITQSSFTAGADWFDAALDCVKHRGPDDRGKFQTDRVYLGLQRLSIIDLSMNAHQPMANDNGSLVLIMNGEIYNFQELRTELEAKGQTFRSRSDTEVLLKLFELEGEDCLQKLCGMFSFAIYNAADHSLFFARDHLGQKPFLYFQSEQMFVFGQEVKSFYYVPQFSKVLDLHSLQEYLQAGSIAAPKTIYRSLRALLPGSCGWWKNGKVTTRRYWTPSIDPNLYCKDFDDAKSSLRETMIEVCRQHLVSDVPLGAFLSGGVDSTLIVGIMSQLLKRKTQTVSIEFDVARSEYNEDRDFALQMSEVFGTDHHRVLVTKQDVLDHLPTFIRVLDQPSCDAMNTYFVSKAAREKVTVALSGIGGDEMFSGYNTFRLIQAVRRLSWLGKAIPRSGRNKISELLGHLPPELLVHPMATAADFILGSRDSVNQQYAALVHFHDDYEISRLFHKDLELPLVTENAFLNESDERGLDPLSQLTLLSIRAYLQPTLLRDADVLGMAHSLEIRVPFVDRRVCELALRIPPSFKLRNGKTKVVLTEAFRDILPAGVIRRKKRGFLLPIVIWLRDPQLRSLVFEALSVSSVEKRRIFRSEEVQRLVNEFYASTSEKPRMYKVFQRVWTLFVFELWCRQNLDSAT